jgi:cytochrome c-type biogenesis protein CcmH
MRWALLWLSLMAPVHAGEPAGDEAEEALTESLADLGIEPEGDPLEGEASVAQADEIGTKLRCPQCQGLSVSDSKADAARAIYERILELVQQGYSEEQILDYFVSRYGEGILLEPKAEGMNWVIWAGPGVAVLLGLSVVIIAARRRNKVGSVLIEKIPAGDVAEDAGLQTLDDARSQAGDPYLNAILAEVAARTGRT